MKPITIAEVSECLEQFAMFTRNQMASTFWRNKRLRSHPEAYAQSLLHSFLAARFQVHADIFEEVHVSFGRIDLLVRFDRGPTVMIELKMCGGGYSAGYAAAGEVQLADYMQKRKTNVGFLVVFDSRLQENGSSLLSDAAESMSIRELFIDVRRPARLCSQ